MFSFDFEKPLQQLEERIRKMKEAGLKDGKNSFEAEIAQLEEELYKTHEEIYSHLTPWQKVQISRHPDRPSSMDYISHIFDNFIELHGDRNIRDDKSMVGGFAMLNDKPVMVIAQEKGKSTREKQYRNFGMNSPEGYKKSVRLMKLAEKFNKPVICFIDTPGASPGLDAEKHGQAEAIGKNISVLLNLKVPTITVIVGEGSSAGALSIGACDKVLMMEYTWYSVISPETCSSLLWHDWDHKEEAAESMKITADDLIRFRIIDRIIKEPAGGAHKDPEACYKSVRENILSCLAELESSAENIVDERIKHFISFGNFADTGA